MIKYKIANNEDIEMLQELRMEMLREVNNLAIDYKFTNEFIENSKKYFLQGNQVTVIALENEIAIGCASISYITVMPTFDHPTGKRAHLMNVYTKSEYRRCHVAKKMVEILIEDAKDKEVTEISLDSTESGRKLYHSLGFKDSSECMNMVFK